MEFDGVFLSEDRGVLTADVKMANSPNTRRLVLRPISGTTALVLGALADRGDLIQGLTRDAHVELQALGLRFRKVTQPLP